MTGEKIVNTFCAPHCFGYPCEFQVTVRDGKAVRLKAHPKMKYPPCPKGWTNIKRLYHPDRVKYPMKRVGERGEGKWQRISWDEALDTVVRELSEIKAKHGNESIVLYTYTASHGVPVGGTPGKKSSIWRLFNLWGGCIPAFDRGNLCWAALIEASNRLFGSMNWGLPPDNDCQLIIVWGTNPAETAIRGTMDFFLEAKRRGTKFVFIDPWLNPSAEKLADEWVPIRPGTDAALALAMLNTIISEGFYDHDFVLHHTNAPFLVRTDNGELLRQSHVAAGGSDQYMVWDATSGEARTVDIPGVAPALTGSYTVDGIEFKPVWQLLIDNVRDWTPQRAEAVTTIPADTILRIAREFGQAEVAKAYVGASPGFNRASWGENTVYSIGMLNAISGNFRGVIYRFLPRRPGPDIGIFETARKLEVPNPVSKRFPINHLAEAILNPQRYDTNIHAIFVLGGNPVNQQCNANKTVEALKKLDLVVVCDAFMSATAKYADILLPECTFLEKTSISEGSQATTVRYCLLYYSGLKPQLFYREAAVPPQWESKTDFDIIRELAIRMGLGRHFPWQNEEQWIAELLNIARDDPRFPWFKEITMERLKREGVIDIDMPPLEPTLNFATPSGRVELYSEPLLKAGYDPIPVYREPEEGREATPDLYRKYPLNLISPHSLGRSHSSYANQPELLKRFRPDVLISIADARKRGIKDGDRVVVFNDRGRIEMDARVSRKIKPGVVRIYEGGWPEYGMANALTLDGLTSYGENPIFNTCLVEVKKAEG